ncbi:bacterio-opsin activator domain-containing protein [Halomicrobium urmianum]|uniref:bacterio-opsin activator domain-containing protein n=1 Tax=Halomicrobium urmianum TaxID=1586233 RepID=UPI001CDA2A77|nr:bacterio-opsin activator domain-containing protein [Halomicrobium urmianum]
MTLDRPVTIVVVGECDRLERALSAFGGRREDATVLTVPSEQSAVRRLADGADTDLIVSAQSLADSTGVEFLRRVRTRYPDLPFVLAGTDVSVADERAAIEAGATDVVRLDSADPAGNDVLQARVERVLDRERTDQSLGDASGRLLGGAHATVRTLFDASSREAVAEAVVETATAELELTHASMYLFDDVDRRLHRVASEPDGASDPEPANTEYTDAVWETYVTGDPQVSSTGSTGDPAATLVLPVGEVGVLRVGAGSVARLDDRRRQLTALSTAATAAFEQVQRDRSLRDRERDLAEQADRIDRRSEHVDHLRTGLQATIEADSREELRRRVCEQLLTDERFAFVRVEALADGQDRLAPRTAAGDGRGYLDAVDLTVDEGVGEPAVQAARSASAVVVEDVTAGLREGDWREQALARGFQSVASVPLVDDGRLRGALTVHATEPDVFDETVRRVLGDVADAMTVGLAIHERRQALLSDTVIDLELRLSRGTDLFSRVARETGATLTFEGSLARNGTAVVFLRITGADPATVETAFGTASLVDAVDHVSHSDSALFEIELRPASLVSEILDWGGTITDLSADDTTTSLAVTLPVETDVRQFVESLERVAPSLQLHSRTQRTRPSDDMPFRAAIEQRLTDRQLEVLRTALLSGYFEWPREHTAEEVAGLLSISQPTFNRHLRVALRKLLVGLFDAEKTSDQER